MVIPSEYLERHKAAEPPGGVQAEAVWQENVFTDSEMDDIIAMNKQIVMEPGPLGSLELNTGQWENVVDPIIRHCSIGFMFPNDDTEWIFERVVGTAAKVNSETFNYELDGLKDGLQLTCYDSEGQHYGWHQDRGFGTFERKLSMTLQLSDPKDYDGGELELKWAANPLQAKKERGVATFFPSFTTHRVTPVTRGRRYSLVAWFVGPPFK